MRGKAIIDANPQPDRQEIRKALTPNLCRCTGYKKIEDAILMAAEALKENKTVEELILQADKSEPSSKAPHREQNTSRSEGRFRSSKGSGVGEREPKYDARKLALGQRPFVSDMSFKGMLHGALKFSDHPRAKVISSI